MKEIYFCECCGFVSTKLIEFKMVGLDEMGNPVYACKQCPPFSKNTEQQVQPDSGNQTMQCPKCGHEEEDLDGFGFIGQCPKCEYCTNPNSTMEIGKWICGVCGKEVTHRANVQ